MGRLWWLKYKNRWDTVGCGQPEQFITGSGYAEHKSGQFNRAGDARLPTLLAHILQKRGHERLQPFPGTPGGQQLGGEQQEFQVTHITVSERVISAKALSDCRSDRSLHLLFDGGIVVIAQGG